MALPVFLLLSGVLFSFGGLTALAVRRTHARYRAQLRRGTVWRSKSVERDVEMFEYLGSITGRFFLVLGLVLFVSGLVVLGVRTI